jgi:hypothetical protein
VKKRERILAFLAALCLAAPLDAAAKRVVVIKVDGLPEDLLKRNLDQLPTIRRVFVEQGGWVRNFYVRGISLSAPSWSMLDSGQHMVIRGNAEFDRYMPRVYDYLNFFPFYVGYARAQRADMPAVEVLDQAGIPLLSDLFPQDQRYQSMQLYQRGVHWETLSDSLRSKVEQPVKNLIDEWQTGFDMSEGIERQEERELIGALANPQILYLDYYTGDVDHVMHLTNNPLSQLNALKRLDATVGRVSAAIQASPLSAQTLMVLVSDHGMNSTPGAYSQGYNLVRFFNSAAGGGHHVLSNRHPLSEYKLRGLDPFVSAVVTPSEESFYLSDQKDWPTAMLDLDGNERASIQLRNSDWNEIQILLREMENARDRRALAARIVDVVDRNRADWSRTTGELREELAALHRAIDSQKTLTESKSAKRKTLDERREARRAIATLDTWRKDETGFTEYLRTLERLLALKSADLEKQHPAVTLPKGVFGDSNSISQLENYAVGWGNDGNFRRMNYFQALSEIRVRNVVQAGLGAKPVDFIAARAKDGIYLYGDEQHSALILSRMQDGELWLRYMPVCGADFAPADWGPGYPLHLLEDPDLNVNGDRRAWLDEWHSEREWLDAAHRARYSNAIIGLEEYFAHWQPESVPDVFKIADSRDWPVLQRFAARLRRVVEPDILLLANDHWNFNVRGFNPGGNHGSFFRISTHSVFMAAGAGVPAGVSVESPYDSLSFVPTVLALMGKRSEQTLPGPVVAELLPH